MFMASLAAAIAGFGLLALRLGGVPFSILVPMAMLGLSAALYLSRGIPKFLRVFRGC